MGGYGTQIYEYIKPFLSITFDEYTKLWNEKIYPHRTSREYFHGIWMKIAFQNALTKDIGKFLVDTDRTDASYAVPNIANALLLFCIDGLSTGGKFIDFPSWLSSRGNDKAYSYKEIKRMYAEYQFDCGITTKFIQSFEGFIELNLIQNYVLYFSKKANDFDLMSHPDRKKIIDQAKNLWNEYTEIEKAHWIGKYYYQLHRNLFVHSGQTPITTVPEWVIHKLGESRDSYHGVYFMPEIGLISGHIIGDEIIHLEHLLKLLLAKKISSINNEKTIS